MFSSLSHPFDFSAVVYDFQLLQNTTSVLSLFRMNQPFTPSLQGLYLHRGLIHLQNQQFLSDYACPLLSCLKFMEGVRTGVGREMCTRFVSIFSSRGWYIYAQSRNTLIRGTQGSKKFVLESLFIVCSCVSLNAYHAPVWRLICLWRDWFRVGESSLGEAEEDIIYEKHTGPISSPNCSLASAMS